MKGAILLVEDDLTTRKFVTSLLSKAEYDVAVAGDEGRLFGSVTSSDISGALAEQGIEIDRHIIRLSEPIKQLGMYKVPVRLHADVQPEVSVWVVAED